MKDYSLNDKDRKNFVLDYKISKDGKIIVRMAKGDPLVLPYNEHNEQTLLRKMEQQVKEASGTESKHIDEKEKNIKFLKILSGIIAASAIFVFASDIVFLDTICWLLISFASVGGVINAAKVVQINNLLRDLKLNQEFLEIKDKINANVKSNQNVLINVSSNTKNAVQNRSNDKPIFDINSFNNYSYRDLETIIENIERNEIFGFDYTEPKKSSKPKTRTKKIEKNRD